MRGPFSFSLPFALAIGAAFGLVGEPRSLRAPDASDADRGRPIVLWAWEREEDLRFLAGRDVAVAFLAATARLDGDEVTLVPRRQPLRVDPSTPLTAVMRIEVVPGRAASLEEAPRARIAAEAARLARLPGVGAVQIDFDARRSQRAGYRTLLRDVRATLPRATRLSMTALASWCLGDRWLDEEPLPVDEVVPMLFSLGPEANAAWRALAAEGDFASARCRGSVGLATFDRLPHLPSSSTRTRYLFSKRAWDKDALAIMIRRLDE